MWNRSYVLNPGNYNPRSLDGSYGRLSATAGTPDKYLDLTQTVFLSFLSRSLGCQLSRVGRTFSRAFKTSGAGTSPGDDPTFLVCKSDDCIIKRRLDISLTFSYLFALSPSCAGFLFRHILSITPLLLGRSTPLSASGHCLTESTLGPSIGSGPLSPTR